MPIAAHRSDSFTQKATDRLSRSRSVVRRFTSRRSLPAPRALRSEALALPAVDALLADPVAERLLDDAELASDVGDRSSLVDHERRGVSPELLRIATATSPARPAGLVSSAMTLLLIGVSGSRGDAQRPPTR